MAINIGRQLYFGFTEEGTRLTAESSAAKWLPILSNSLDKVIDYTDDDSAFGVRHSMMKRHIEYSRVEGDITVLPDATHAGDLFYYFFGSVNSVQESTSGAYKHTFSPLENTQLPTFTGFYNLPNTGDLKANGLHISQLQISAEVNSRAELTATIMGLSETPASSATPAYADPTMPMQSRFLKVSYADAIDDLESSGTLFDARSVDLTISNNSELDPALGSLTPVDVYAKNFTIEGTISIVMKASTFETFRTAGTKKALRFEFENTAAPVLGTASGLYPMMRVDVGPTLFEITRQKELNDVVMLELTIKPEYDFSDSKYIIGYVQNEVASY